MEQKKHKWSGISKVVQALHNCDGNMQPRLHMVLPESCLGVVEVWLFDSGNPLVLLDGRTP